MIATLATSSATHAATVAFDFSAFDASIIHDGTSLSDSTFLDLDDAALVVTSLGLGDVSGLSEGDTVTLSPSKISYGSTPGPLGTDVVLSWPMVVGPGMDMFAETLTTVTSIITNPADPGFINVVLTGTLTDSAGTFMDAPVVLMFTATQAGTNIPSVAFSNATTGVTPSIPEPSTWAMMALGFAALGWAASRRRKANLAMLSV
jgi:hypothetical protein